MDKEVGGRERTADQHFLRRALCPGAVGKLVTEAASDTNVYLHKFLPGIVGGG